MGTEHPIKASRWFPVNRKAGNWQMKHDIACAFCLRMKETSALFSAGRKKQEEFYIEILLRLFVYIFF